MSLADTPARPGMAARLRAASGRTAGLLERAFAFHSRAGARRAAAAVAALAALLSLLRGQDANWDLRNYHLHNAWSWFEGRLGLDLAPAQLQSYFTPWLDLPYYLLVQHAPAPLAGAVLGALHGLAFVPLAWIAWRLLAADPQRARMAPVLALAGLASAVFLSELGNTMGDNSTAPLVLGALALCLPGERWRAARVLGAGALLGLAVGLKLTNATYAVALGLAVLAAPRPWRERLGAAAGLTAATALAFALVAGPWLYRIWNEFGNPLFPQYNAWFRRRWPRPTSPATCAGVPAMRARCCGGHCCSPSIRTGSARSPCRSWCGRPCTWPRLRPWLPGLRGAGVRRRWPRRRMRPRAWSRCSLSPASCCGCWSSASTATWWCWNCWRLCCCGA